MLTESLGIQENSPLTHPKLVGVNVGVNVSDGESIAEGAECEARPKPSLKDRPRIYQELAKPRVKASQWGLW